MVDSWRVRGMHVQDTVVTEAGLFLLRHHVYVRNVLETSLRQPHLCSQLYLIV